MPAQRGKDFLLKVGDGASPEVFTTVAGLRATALSIDGDSIDVGTKDDFIGDVLWQKLLSGGGVRSVTLTAGGVWLGDDTGQQALADDMLTGTIKHYQLDDGTRVWEGAFQPTSFSQSGDHDAEQDFDITLESDGQITISTP